MEENQQYIMQRRRTVNNDSSDLNNSPSLESTQAPISEIKSTNSAAAASWKRILLLIVAVTIHNIPGKVSGLEMFLFIHLLFRQ